MAAELCPENSGLAMSPRISFSHYLSHYDAVPPVEQRLFRSTSSSGNIDFDFNVRKSHEQESSSADELFSGGQILPTQIKNKTPPPPPQPPNQSHDQSEPQQPCERRDNDNSCEGESSKETKDEKQNQNANSKSFWRFKRSNSLNCSNGYGPSLCPLQILSRSNSTGSSSTSVKRSTTLSKDNHHTQKQNSQKVSLFASKSKSLKSSSSLSSSGNHQRPPLKKSYCRSYHGNGTVGVNPVLNVHYGNLFCLGSIFFSGKDKNKKK